MAPLTSRASSEWSTPQDFFDKLDNEFQFSLDVAANSFNTKCLHFLSRADNALETWWGKNRCWMNPPFDRIAAFTKKAYEQSLEGSLVVALIPARTDTRWFHDYILGKAEIRFVKGRLKFGGSKQNAPFPCLVIIWRPKP